MREKKKNGVREWQARRARVPNSSLLSIARYTRAIWNFQLITREITDANHCGMSVNPNRFDDYGP